MRFHRCGRRRDRLFELADRPRRRPSVSARRPGWHARPRSRGLMRTASRSDGNSRLCRLRSASTPDRDCCGLRRSPAGAGWPRGTAAATSRHCRRRCGRAASPRTLCASALPGERRFTAVVQGRRRLHRNRVPVSTAPGEVQPAASCPIAFERSPAQQICDAEIEEDRGRRRQQRNRTLQARSRARQVHHCSRSAVPSIACADGARRRIELGHSGEAPSTAPLAVTPLYPRADTEVVSRVRRLRTELNRALAGGWKRQRKLPLLTEHIPDGDCVRPPAPAVRARAAHVQLRVRGRPESPRAAALLRPCEARASAAPRGQRRCTRGLTRPAGSAPAPRP